MDSPLGASACKCPKKRLLESYDHDEQAGITVPKHCKTEVVDDLSKLIPHHQVLSSFEFYRRRDIVNSKQNVLNISKTQSDCEKFSSHRKIIIQWLKVVCNSMNFSSATFFLGINIFDRYCKACTVALKDFELFSLVALFISAKYTENETPLMKKYEGLLLCDMVLAERQILSKLEFELTVPTVYTTLMYLGQILSISPEILKFSENLLLETLSASSDLESNTFEAAVSMLLFSCKTANSELYNVTCKNLKRLMLRKTLKLSTVV